jgi:hypothetical protein
MQFAARVSADLLARVDAGRTEVARRLAESAPTVVGRIAHERYQQRGDPL